MRERAEDERDMCDRCAGAIADLCRQCNGCREACTLCLVCCHDLRSQSSQVMMLGGHDMLLFNSPPSPHTVLRLLFWPCRVACCNEL